MKRLNDYELIYLLRTEYDEYIMDFFIKKYDKFIWKYIHLLDVPIDDQLDFYQEACLLLVHCVKFFNEKYGKTLTKYFELVLKRKFYSLKLKLPSYIIDIHSVMAETMYFAETDDDLPKMLTEIEKYVYQYYFKERVQIKELVAEGKYTNKQIYNAIYRMKEKYKNMI